MSRIAAISKQEIAGLALLTALAAVILYWRWVGFQGHDDAFYASAAMDWLQTPAPLGTNHWALRYALVLPAAGLMALFGPSVLALIAMNLVSYFGFLVVGYAAVRHWFGWGAAVALVAIYITLPQFPVQATYANPDLIEMFFATASIWTLLWARERCGHALILMLSGVLAGLGFLTRETSVILIILYAILFAFRPGMRRWRYLFVALGFVVMIGAQAGYFAVRTGDPLYRMRISFTHDQVDRNAKRAEAETAGNGLDSEGVLVTTAWYAPFAAIFVSQKYGLLFFLAIPAYVVARRGTWLNRNQVFLLDFAALGAVVAFVFVAVNSTVLYIVPRYFMVPAALAAVPVAVLIARWVQQGGRLRWTAAAAASGFVLSSLLLLYLENVRPLLAGERIVAFVAASDVPVHIDPETLRQIRFLLIAGDLLSRVRMDAPGPGALVASIDGVVRRCLDNASCGVRDRMAGFEPRPGWVAATRFDPPRRWVAGVLEFGGLGERLPPDIKTKIGQPGASGTVFRTP